MAQTAEPPGKSDQGSPSASTSTSSITAKDEGCSTAGAVEREVTVRLDDDTLEVISKQVGAAAQCVEVSLPFPGRIVIVKNGMALVSLFPQGLAVVDLRDPIRPRYNGMVHPELAISSMRESGGILWLVDSTNVITKIALQTLLPTRVMPPSTMQAAPVRAVPSKPSQSPNDKGPLITEIWPGESSFRIDGSSLLLRAQNDGVSGGSTIYVDFEGSIIAVLRSGSALYVAHRDNLISILDVSNPTSPQKLGMVGTQVTIATIRLGSFPGTLLVDEKGGGTRTYTTEELKRLARMAKRVAPTPAGLSLVDRYSKSERTTLREGISLEVSAEGAYRWVLIDSILLGCASVTLAKEGGSYAFGGILSGCVGKTLVGLTTAPLSVGLAFDAKARPWLRLGLTLTSGAVLLWSVSNRALGFGSLGISAQAKFDLYRSTRGPALFLLIRGGVDILPSLGSASPLAMLGIGFRVRNLDPN